MRIVIVDDQAEFRASLQDLLGTVSGIEVVGEAKNGEEAIGLVLEMRPDVTLMDIRMPQRDGISATAAIRERWPQACVLVLTTFDEDELIGKAMRAGAAGYLLKGTPVDDLVAILRLASRGYVAIGRGTVRATEDEATAQARERIAQLSERERQIWSLIGAGHTNRDIAQRLFLTEGTVKNYITTILGTLQVRHRTEAALLWRQLSG